MENVTFKTAVVGGFERQSVVDYIEKNAKEATELRERLEKEVETLKHEKAALDTEVTQLRSTAEQLRKENARLTTENEKLKSENEASTQLLQETQPRLEELESQMEQMRPEAEAYGRVKAHIGDIECSARKRADDLEVAVAAKLAGLLGDFRVQYKDLVSTFEGTSAHVVSELRKVEVNLAQLPVTFDKMSGELAELEAVLKKD